MVATITIAYASEEGICPTVIGDLDAYFENPDAIQGEYTFDGTYPNCTVTQGACPKP